MAPPDSGKDKRTREEPLDEIARLQARLRQSQEELERHVAELQDTRDRYEAQGEELVATCEDLAAARDKAVYANHHKSQFLAYMSHEIRTPLNAILGFSEVIRDEVLGPVTPEKYREYAGDIHTSGDHLLELINDILDLSKIEAGKLEIEEAEIDVAASVEASLRFVRERANKAGLSLKTETPPGLLALHADVRMVKQMLINLLTNAVKFTPSGGEITVAAVRGGSGGLELSVRDTGAGIAPEDLSKVMKAYGQAGKTRSRGFEGTGLGLQLVKKMIELHGGSVELQSELGAGTTFTLRFPPERLLDGPAKAVA